jgi:hypothetical protein
MSAVVPRATAEQRRRTNVARRAVQSNVSVSQVNTFGGPPRGGGNAAAIRARNRRATAAGWAGTEQACGGARCFSRGRLRPKRVDAPGLATLGCSGSLHLLPVSGAFLALQAVRRQEVVRKGKGRVPGGGGPDIAPDSRTRCRRRGPAPFKGCSGSVPLQFIRSRGRGGSSGRARRRRAPPRTGAYRWALGRRAGAPGGHFLAYLTEQPYGRVCASETVLPASSSSRALAT